MLRKILSAWSVREFAPGVYPQRRDDQVTTVDRQLGLWAGRVKLWLSALRRIGLRRFAAQVETHGTSLRAVTDEALRQRIQALRERLPSTGWVRGNVVESFALACEVCHRCLGKRPYPVQVMGGYALFTGRQAEMATGEGKSLTAVLPAVAAALARVPVHVVTVNEYLAKRDAEAMRPVFEFFALSVGWIEPDQDTETRRAMYACDVTYCVNKDLVFDYLRDFMAAENLVSQRALALRHYLEPGRAPGSPQGGHILRGLCFAIVDEADSIFIDEARTPLIISRSRDDASEADRYAHALGIAGRLMPRAFEIRASERTVRLTPSGQESVAQACADMGGMWRFRKAREELVQQALSALHLFERDTHYIVVDGKVQIVDEFTGRTMADRSWERGLHQLIETKEGLETTAPRETIARITYQRFFRRYLKLSGMTGTGAEVAPELRSVFGMDTIRIPTHRLCMRKCLGERVFFTDEARWRAVLARILTVRTEGRAVLVGTRSVDASERLGRLLAVAGVPHTLLNARQDADEASIVSQAGQPGRVTVATNMAGRGTDILLDASVREAGGLHVILTEFHESRRIDRQLFGRAGRQGDPGSYESLVSLEDELFRIHGSVLLRLIHRRAWPGERLPEWVGSTLRFWAQSSAERLHARIRKRTLESEKLIDRSLAFSGRGE